MANFDLSSGSTVTITGLTGTLTSDTASLSVTTTWGLLGTTGAWTHSIGRVMLTAASGGMDAGTSCVVTFYVQNQGTTQKSPTVSVSASILTGNAQMILIAETEMTKTGMNLHGISSGADPLRIEEQQFSVLSIGQSTPASHASNTLTATLTTNFHLARGSTVTISGLMGSQTASTAALHITSTTNVLGQEGAWRQDTGRLVLTVESEGKP